MDQASFQRASGALNERLAAALAKLALVGRSALGKAAQRQSLSPVQVLILERLAKAGPASVGALARLLAVTAPTASDSIAALERKKLVRRRSGDGDGRRVEVHPTASGRRFAERQPFWPEVFAAAVAELSEAEKAVLLRLLLRLIAELVARGVIAEARLCVTCEHFRPHAHAERSHPHHCALVDLPLSDAHLRVDCPDHVPSPAAEVRRRLAVLRGAAR